MTDQTDFKRRFNGRGGSPGQQTFVSAAFSLSLLLVFGPAHYYGRLDYDEGDL